MNVANVSFDIFVPIRSHCHVDLHLGNLVYEMSRKLTAEQLEFVVAELTTARNYAQFNKHMEKFLI